MKNIQIILIIVLAIIIGIIIFQYLKNKEDYQPQKYIQKIGEDIIKYLIYTESGFTWGDLINLYKSGSKGKSLANKISKQYFLVSVPELKNIFSFKYAWNVDNSNPNWIENFDYFTTLRNILGFKNNNTSQRNLQPEYNLLYLNDISHRFSDQNENLLNLLNENLIQGDKFILFNYIFEEDTISRRIEKVLTTTQILIKNNQDLIQQLDQLANSLLNNPDLVNLTGPPAEIIEIENGRIYIFNLKVSIITPKDLAKVEWSLKKVPKDDEKQNDPDYWL